MKINTWMRIAVLMLLFNSRSAADSRNGVLIIPQAAYPPLIDGSLEGIWYTASTERVVKQDQEDPAPPDGYLDLFCTMRLLWIGNRLWAKLWVT